MLPLKVDTSRTTDYKNPMFCQFNLPHVGITEKITEKKLKTRTN